MDTSLCASEEGCAEGICEEGRVSCASGWAVEGSTWVSRRAEHNASEKVSSERSVSSVASRQPVSSSSRPRSVWSLVRWPFSLRADSVGADRSSCVAVCGERAAVTGALPDWERYSAKSRYSSHWRIVPMNTLRPCRYTVQSRVAQLYRSVNAGMWTVQSRRRVKTRSKRLGPTRRASKRCECVCAMWICDGFNTTCCVRWRKKSA
jgi:hypothetical protein